MILAPASVLTVHVGSLLLESMREGSIVLICAVCHPKRLQWGFHSGHWNRAMMVDQSVLQNPKELLFCWGEKLTISVTLPEASEDTCNRCVEVFLSKIPLSCSNLEPVSLSFSSLYTIPTLYSPLDLKGWNYCRCFWCEWFSSLNFQAVMMLSFTEIKVVSWGSLQIQCFFFFFFTFTKVYGVMS